MEELRTLKTEESFEEPETGKRKRGRAVYEDDSIVSARRHKRIMLSLTKPSYLLGLGPSSRSFRWEHRQRLCKILCELVRRHNWREASGVLSVLMQGTQRESSPALNRLKYSLCIEILRYMQEHNINTSRISHVYDTWISRTGCTKDRPVEDRLLVYLEQIIHFLIEEKDEDASHTASSLMQHREFSTRPFSYLVIGLTFYQLWYSKFLKEVQDEGIDHTPSHSEMSGPRFTDPDEESHGYNAVYSHETETSVRHDSEASVMNNKKISGASIKTVDREASMEVDVRMPTDNHPLFTQPLRVYATSEENQTSLDKDVSQRHDAAIISALGGIDSWLLPLRLPQNFDYQIQMLNHPYYKDAVKHLQLALHSTPPQLAALQPLVQLLLVGGRVDNAMNEVETLCHDSAAVLPSRIRASILECFDPNSNMLSSYYEDILKKDPTCCHSLRKLIEMHQNGNYNPESLVEIIALHLDAAFGDHDTWREFGLCFLKLCQCDEDRLSVCLNGKEGEQKQTFAVSYNRTPKIFTDGKSGKAWRFRCRWWLRRHFSRNTLSSEIAKGDQHLLTYRAACASHMYGQEFGYVLEVYSHLQKINDRDLFMFLRLHMQNSIRICPNLQDTCK